jgi:hypothetical protein
MRALFGFPDSEAHQAENWVVRIGWGFKPMLFVNGVHGFKFPSSKLSCQLSTRFDLFIERNYWWFLPLVVMFITENIHDSFYIDDPTTTLDLGR